MTRLNALNTRNSCDGRYQDSLDVRFTKACDNHCSFCIEKKGIDSLGRPDVDALIRKTLDSGQQSILILGGEPFLEVSRLLKYIQGIRPHVREIFITTSIPRSLDPESQEVRAILLVIDGLNVSIQHMNPTLNNEVLNASDRFNRIERLGCLLKEEAIAKKIRVSLNLSVGFIDERQKIIGCITRLKQLGCRHVKLNELQNVPAHLYVSFEQVFGLSLPAPYAFGCQTDISDLFEGIQVTLKRSCFQVLPEELAKSRVNFWDVVKLVYKHVRKPAQTGLPVLYEDGSCSSGWLVKKEG